MTEEEIQGWKDKINGMDQTEMARVWRHSPTGHPIFTNDTLGKLFVDRFEELGGMTSEVSKKIGW